MFTARSKKVAFAEVENGTFNRMKGFTALTTNRNPQEYTRQYVDEAFETTDVTAISTSMDFTFDQMQGDPVHDMMIDIIDGEKIGDDAIVPIVVVDFTQEGTSPGSYKASQRDFVLVPETEGDEIEAYSYSGTFRVKGPKIDGEATTTDDWKTCTFIADSGDIDGGETGV